MSIKLNSWLDIRDLVQLKDKQFMIMTQYFDSEESLVEQTEPQIKICSSFDKLIEAMKEFMDDITRWKHFRKYNQYRENSLFLMKGDQYREGGLKIFVYNLDEKHHEDLVTKLLKM